MPTGLQLYPCMLPVEKLMCALWSCEGFINVGRMDFLVVGNSTFNRLDRFSSSAILSTYLRNLILVICLT